MLRILVRTVLAVVAVLVAVVALEIIASESGEVVVLRTTDADGGPHETRLWIVDDGSHAWLRAGHDGSGWYRQLRERPEVAVVRGDRTLRARAVPEVGARPRINALMREKYGWADAYIGALFGRDDAIPIRLDPL